MNKPQSRGLRPIFIHLATMGYPHNINGEAVVVNAVGNTVVCAYPDTPGVLLSDKFLHAMRSGLVSERADSRNHLLLHLQGKLLSSRLALERYSIL